MKTFLLLALTLLSLTSNADAACRSRYKADKYAASVGGRQGKIVDHICALAVGGLDIPANMQLQTITDSRIKDRIENTAKGRVLYCNEKNSLPYRTVYNCK